MKRFAPILIALIFIGYLAVLVNVFSTIDYSNEPLNVKLMIWFWIGVWIALMAAMIYTVMQRLKEINKEDKDDLSKYWLYFRKRSWYSWHS